MEYIKRGQCFFIVVLRRSNPAITARSSRLS